MLLITLVSGSLLMVPGIKMSQAYHNVRNQSVMKLYVVFSVLEIFDKLCASFGQDILESLFASATSVRLGSGYALWLDLTVAYGYLTAHTLVLFYQVVALSVAINSNSNVLLTLLISNNFTELKTCARLPGACRGGCGEPRSRARRPPNSTHSPGPAR